MRRDTGAGRIRGLGIEWDAVRDLLGGEARTAMGRERALAAEPFTDPTAIQAAIEATRQARLALADVGSPPLDTVPDIRSVLDRCRVPGSVLDGSELLALLPLLDACPHLTAWGRSVRPVAPTLSDLTDHLPTVGDLRDRLRPALADDGTLTDDASPRLRHLRRRIREHRRRIVADLERRLGGSDVEQLFTDRYVTVRHGRYVLPVRADARSRVPGIVHDRSQSGQTLFVEPAEGVEANNDLVQLGREEEQETARILAELTEAVRARLDDLDAVVEAVAALDWIAARAHLAERMEATAPRIDPGGRVALRSARHPLLLAQSWKEPARPAVPVDLDLGPERPMLLITGPNAGGKTIALKTLGLHVLMAQSGCHLPADEGSRLPVFGALHAIIGDDQSVAENLSTFSAFVRQVRAVLAEADEHSLVLLDELGAGTDPEEGAALAQAILEELVERGAKVLATTHLEPLKAFASTHPRARNASVEFDTGTLAPTFRLLYDRPGRSYALTIAARLGLPARLIERAREHRSEQGARLGDLLARLDEASRAGAERARAIEASEHEAAVRLTAARETEAAAEARAREIVARAKTEASGLLGEIRRAITAEWERLKRAERSRSDLDASRRRLGEVAARLAPSSPADGERLEPLRPGATVAAEHLGLRGELVALAGSTATVRAGNVTVRVPTSALRVVEARAPEEGRPPVRQGDTRGRVGAREIAAEILLLGRTTDEARDLVEQYLDDAFMAGLPRVRLIHGKGTGALRKAVRDLLAAHPLVGSYRDGEPSEGGAGATVALLKES